MIPRLLTRTVLVLVLGSTPAFAQGRPPAPPAPSAPPAPPAPSAPSAPSTPAPKIRRWLDVQSLQFASRFRWIESSRGTVNSSTLQWQPQVRARFLFDARSRYSVNVGAFSGSTLISGWNNTGGGIGDYTGAFNVKQLFLSAEPVKGAEFQAGGLYMNRGEQTELTSYDNDSFIVGERATIRPSKGALTQVAITAGYYGDYREPNFFTRADRLNEWNYGQVLVGLKLGPRAAASADYTYEAGRDIVREAVTIRAPAKTKVLTSVKLEAYQRLENGNGLLLNKRGAGFHVSSDLRVKRLTVTVGVASVDRYYGPYNGDRYDVGSRVYTIGTYTLTRDVTLGWFHGEAFNVDYPIANKHRWEAIVTINPTASLKRARIF